jgi:hypothetical protein
VAVVLDPEPLVAADEVQVVVADQRPGQQVGLAQDLEAVADAEHRQPAAAASTTGAHDRGEPGDRPAAQVVAVGEAAGQDDRVDPCRSASACHSATGSPPAIRTARAASRSSSDPGKVTTPIAHQPSAGSVTTPSSA